MKLSVLRKSLHICPESNFSSDDERDIAYIEDVLGLRNEGDSVSLVRKNASGLNCIAYLETVKNFNANKNLKIKIHPDCPNKDPILPPAIDGDIGYDLRLWVDNRTGRINIPPNTMMDIRTGVYVELPEGYWGDVRARSSTFAKRQLFVMNGVIDQKYRGELSVFVYNLTKEDHEVCTGDRLAQLVILPACVFPINVVQELSTTERNTAGFGSTGI